jgi:hypothetical protein
MSCPNNHGRMMLLRRIKTVTREREKAMPYQSRSLTTNGMIATARINPLERRAVDIEESH